MPSWEEMKQRAQGAFKVLYGEAMAFDMQRAQNMMLSEAIFQDAYQAELARDAEPDVHPLSDEELEKTVSELEVGWGER